MLLAQATLLEQQLAPATDKDAGLPPIRMLRQEAQSGSR